MLREKVRENIGRVGALGDAADRAAAREALVVSSARRALTQAPNGRLEARRARGTEVRTEAAVVSFTLPENPRRLTRSRTEVEHLLAVLGSRRDFARRLFREHEAARRCGHHGAELPLFDRLGSFSRRTVRCAQNGAEVRIREPRARGRVRTKPIAIERKIPQRRHATARRHVRAVTRNGDMPAPRNRRDGTLGTSWLDP